MSILIGSWGQEAIVLLAAMTTRLLFGCKQHQEVVIERTKSTCHHPCRCPILYDSTQRSLRWHMSHKVLLSGIKGAPGLDLDETSNSTAWLHNVPTNNGDSSTTKIVLWLTGYMSTRNVHDSMSKVCPKSEKEWFSKQTHVVTFRRVMSLQPSDVLSPFLTFHVLIHSSHQWPWIPSRGQSAMTNNKVTMDLYILVSATTIGRGRVDLKVVRALERCDSDLGQKGKEVQQGWCPANVRNRWPQGWQSDPWLQGVNKCNLTGNTHGNRPQFGPMGRWVGPWIGRRSKSQVTNHDCRQAEDQGAGVRFSRQVQWLPVLTDQDNNVSSAWTGHRTGGIHPCRESESVPGQTWRQDGKWPGSSGPLLLCPGLLLQDPKERLWSLPVQASAECHGKSAGKVAYDRPTASMISFLSKHFKLNNPIEQPNHFVIFDTFFNAKWRIKWQMWRGVASIDGPLFLHSVLEPVSSKEPFLKRIELI